LPKYMKKVLILGSQHGNEVLGINLYNYFVDHYSDLSVYVEYLCGNPRASEGNTRFIDTDLNRSYKRNGRSYEEKRSEEILEFISEGNFDFVLDVHTTTAPIKGLFITTILNDANRQIIRASNTPLIVEIPDEMTKHSLIGNIASSVSVEFNEDNAREASTLEELSVFIEKLITGSSVKPFNRKLLRVTGLIEKDEDTRDFVNFELSPKGYYPVLYGERNYTNYQGFKAESLGTIEL
jgi:succinylglutamate desuccinylase